MKFSKTLLLSVIFVFILLTAVNADERGNEYKVWFDSFLAKFQDSFTPPNSVQKEELDDLLRIKPAYNSGIYYNLWFVQCFCMYVEETSITLSAGEIEKFKYVFSAMPQTDGSEQYYTFYLDYILKNLDEFMPVLSDAEIAFLAYFIKAKPSSTGADYQTWLKAYMELKESYGSSLSEDEKKALKFLNDIKPVENGGSDDVLFKVKRETLLKIRNMIQNQQPNSAIEEINRILYQNGN
ncbi:MAG: hypothetical protein HQM10_05260 [Candidatus Riflebacteria bacterium]|nr:hypothetical protein [Candidatus Riflebacteria bacterium]